MSTLVNVCEVGDLRLRRRPGKEGSTIVEFALQKRVSSGANTNCTWRLTGIRLKWMPRLKTWRLVQFVDQMSKGGRGPAYPAKNLIADFGDLTEEEACQIAMATIQLHGY